jgi:alanine racemase
MKLLSLLRALKKSLSKYNPSVEILIFKDNLLHNLNEYKRTYPTLAFSPVLKSNAYGHGLVEVGRVLDKEDIPFFTVDSLYEAMVLRNQGIRSNILVIGHAHVHNVTGSRLANVSFTITSLAQLEEIARDLFRRKRFHLKIDTGMHRQGVLPAQIEEAMRLIKSNKYILLEGICSHFADADGTNAVFTQSQIKQWQHAVSVFKQAFPDIQYYHVANSAGTFYSDAVFSNVARLGLGLYGINPSPFAKLDLQPALQMESVISSIISIPPGEHVGYNITYSANKHMRVATIPVGYFEWVDQRLSNQGYFKVGNVSCPIVGRVSMNITSIDVTGAPNATRGDKVVIISATSTDPNSVERIAALIGSVPHDTTVHIPQHLRRVVV